MSVKSRGATFIAMKDDPKSAAREVLHQAGLRATQPRIAVLMALQNSAAPLSHSEMLEILGSDDWDPATIYRNLVKLTEVGLAHVVTRAEGMARYALVEGDDAEHHHPHFVCVDCGRVSCLPEEVVAPQKLDGPWASSLKSATLQYHGECPECLTG